MIFFHRNTFCILGSNCDASILVIRYRWTCLTNQMKCFKQIISYRRFVWWHSITTLHGLTMGCQNHCACLYFTITWSAGQPMARKFRLLFIAGRPDYCQKKKKHISNFHAFDQFLEMAKKLIFCIFNQFNQFKQLSMWV